MLLGGSAFGSLFTSHGSAQQAFLLNMNLLFERFVTRLLRDAFHGTAVRVHAQAGNRRALLDEQGRTYKELIPDLVLASGHGPSTRYLCLDAKYKLYDDAQRKLSSADIYQALTYARAYATGPSVPRAFILYASARDDAPRTIALHDQGDAPSARITTHAVNIPRRSRTLENRPGDRSGSTSEPFHRSRRRQLTIMQRRLTCDRCRQAGEASRAVNVFSYHGPHVPAKPLNVLHTLAFAREASGVQGREGSGR